MVAEPGLTILKRGKVRFHSRWEAAGQLSRRWLDIDDRPWRVGGVKEATDVSKVPGEV